MFLFEEIYKRTIWGGNLIAKLKEKVLPTNDVGESWELSGLEGHETLVCEGPDKGKNLREISEKYGEALLGHHVFERFGTEFPLLVKFIDAHKNLSIQVHPDDKMAQRLYGRNGKTELWYVVDAKTDGRLLVGFDHDMTAEDYDESMANGQIAGKVRSHNVKSGDVFFLPPGRVHAACAGVLLAEIQQSSDITYRIYDYGRKDNDGKERELHTSLAKEALNFKSNDDYRTHYSFYENKSARLAECEYFATNLLIIDQPHQIFTSIHDSFNILICVDGEITVVQTDGIHPGESILKKGHTVLVPASATSVRLIPTKTSKLLQVWVP